MIKNNDAGHHSHRAPLSGLIPIKRREQGGGLTARDPPTSPGPGPLRLLAGGSPGRYAAGGRQGRFSVLPLRQRARGRGTRRPEHPLGCPPSCRGSPQLQRPARLSSPRLPGFLHSLPDAGSYRCSPASAWGAARAPLLWPPPPPAQPAARRSPCTSTAVRGGPPWSQGPEPLRLTDKDGRRGRRPRPETPGPRPRPLQKLGSLRCLYEEAGHERPG